MTTSTLRPLGTVAQHRVSLLAEGQFHLTPSYFRGNSLVSNRLWLRPHIGRALRIGAQYRIDERLSVKLNFGVHTWGLALTTRTDAPGGRRYEARGFNNTREESITGALTAVYHLSPPEQRHQWVIEGGLEIITEALPLNFEELQYKGLPLTSGFSFTQGTTLTSTASAGRVTHTHGASARLGIRLGAGREWRIGNRHFVAVKLVACIGLQEKKRWRLDYTTWDIGPTVDPVHYSNEVGTKTSWIGLQTAYRFQL